MSALKIELCPETGICSIIKADKTKIDLMPDEVAAVREAGGDLAKIKAIVAESDATFAEGLQESETRAIRTSLG